VTHYRRRSAWPDADVSLLEVTLETGRTHQIRVHLAGIGHPVLADRVYGGRSTIEKQGVSEPIVVPRLALHAERLAFTHPVTGGELEFVSALPDDLASVVAALDEPTSSE
jgi:23S rRNA pseudouridine1911/1915/1917 synthase